MPLEVSIRKRFGTAFSLSADFGTGDGRLGILGASGSGKSMILKCIAGIEQPDSGRIAVDGRVLYDGAGGVNQRPQRRRVGYLFQNYALFPHMTVEKNIGIGLTLPQADKARRVGEWLNRFRLGGMERRYPGQLSGGQQQRVALARMLAAAPDVVLLDEPFSALDPHLREEMQLQLMDAVKECRNVVMVTHNRDEAYRICSDLLVLDGGNILAKGKTAALFANPGNVTVARVTGCKNISKAEKVSETSVYATDWGIRLATAGPVPDRTAYIGIRAHDFEPVRDGEPDGDNVIAMHVRERTEDLFEWNVIFRNARPADPRGVGDVWWKYSKYALKEPPSRLRFPPSALLCLEA